MDDLDLVPKDVRPLDVQTPKESRNLWNSVTQQIMGKNWGEATREKQVIEQVSLDHRLHALASPRWDLTIYRAHSQAQRDRATEMKRQGQV
jgi:hypothetical protein